MSTVVSFTLRADQLRRAFIDPIDQSHRFEIIEGEYEVYDGGRSGPVSEVSLVTC